MEALPWPATTGTATGTTPSAPGDYDRAAGDPDPFDRPSPDLAWLCHPALTGLPSQGWDALIAALMTLHEQQRETSLAQPRHRPPSRPHPG